MEHKICKKCLIDKPITDYYKVKNSHRGECKLCTRRVQAKQARIYRQNNPDRFKASVKKYYTKNKKQIIAKQKIFYKEHKDQLREKYKNKQKEYYLKNREKKLQYWKDYSQKNKEKICRRNRLYARKKLKTDLHFKILNCLRSRINTALKSTRKLSKTSELIGCSIEIFKLHLEKQFKDGMNWSNHGDWHMGHTIPCSSFDLTKEEEQRKCFHYTNLQPLWRRDNLRKSDNYEENDSESR